MRRRIVIFLTLASLLLCGITAVLWQRSLRHVEGGTWATGRHEMDYYSWSGCLGVVVAFGDGPRALQSRGLQHWRNADTQGDYSMSVSPVIPGPSRWGFGLSIDRTVAPGWQRGGYPLYSIFAPYWFLLTLFALMPIRQLRRRVTRRRRHHRGLCVTCGYDLRASGSFCPECGTQR